MNKTKERHKKGAAFLTTGVAAQDEGFGWTDFELTDEKSGA